MTTAAAVGILRGLRRHDKAIFLPDDATLAATDVDLIGLAGHRQVTDFHLVALVRAHGE